VADQCLVGNMLQVISIINAMVVGALLGIAADSERALKLGIGYNANLIFFTCLPVSATTIYSICVLLSAVTSGLFVFYAEQPELIQAHDPWLFGRLKEEVNAANHFG